MARNATSRQGSRDGNPAAPQHPRQLESVQRHREAEPYSRWFCRPNSPRLRRCRNAWHMFDGGAARLPWSWSLIPGTTACQRKEKRAGGRAAQLAPATDGLPCVHVVAIAPVVARCRSSRLYSLRSSGILTSELPWWHSGRCKSADPFGGRENRELTKARNLLDYGLSATVCLGIADFLATSDLCSRARLAALSYVAACAIRR